MMAASSTLPIRVGAVAILVVLLLAVPPAAHGLTCSEVIKDLKPCIKYLKNGSGDPPSDCCAGASNLASTATSTADKQTACNCIKSASKSINPKLDLAKALPSKCRISLPFEVSPSVDCSKIK